MNIETKIRNLIKYMDEHDQPYDDMFEEIIKLVNKHHDDWYNEARIAHQENEQLRLQCQSAVQDKQSIIASLSTQLKICMKELDIAERTIRSIKNETCFNCDGKQQVVNTKTGSYEICAICEGLGVSPL